jgi:hypothetical protein
MFPISSIAAIFLRPALPPIVIGFGTAVLFGLAVLAYRRSTAARERPVASLGLMAMRIIGILAVASILLGPSVIPPTVDREMRPKVTVLIDVSESMRTPDCGPRSRFEAMSDNWLEPSAMDPIVAVAEVDLRLVGERSEQVGRSAVGQLPADAANAKATRLLEAVTDVLNETLGGGTAADAGRRILVLSDGRDTTGGSPSPAIELARNRGVPIDTVTFGAAVLRRDLAVQSAPTQEFLYADEEGGLIVRLQQTGLPLSEVNVEVKVNGPEGVSTTSHPMDLRGRTVAEIQIPIRHATPGQYEYLISVAGRPEEIDTTNNVQTLFVDVSKAKARVLLLEGQPSWDMKFIAQALRKDPRVELTQVSRLSDKRTEVIVSGGSSRDGSKDGQASTGKPGAGSAGKGEAARILAPESLAKFDVYILGRGIERFGSPELAAALRDRVVERGAGIIFARGAAYAADQDSFAAALGPVEPVTFAARGKPPLKNVRVALTASAASMPWLGSERLGIDLASNADRLAPWPLLHRVDRVKPATIVLARALATGEATEGAEDDDNPPAIVAMRVGRGTSVGLLGEGIWKWALVDRDRERFEGVYERCMQGLIRWVASGGDARPGQEVTLRLGSQSAKIDDSVTIEVLLDEVISPMPTSVTLKHPDGMNELLPISPSPASPLRLDGSFRPSRAGTYMVTLETPGAQPAMQQRFVSAFDPSVERINTSSDPTGMGTLAERTGGRVFAPDEAAKYPEHVRRHRFATIASQEAIWVWNRFPILLMLCTWFGLEWILRRRAGLP